MSSSAAADGQEHQLDPRSVQSARLSLALRAAGMTLVCFIGILVLLVMQPWRPPWNTVGMVALVGLALYQGALAIWWPSLAYRHTSWRLDRSSFRIRRGVVWRSEITVPRTRIQHTDVTRGPVERAFGLATLVVFTAGTEHSRVSLGGLAAETARMIRDYLIQPTDQPAPGAPPVARPVPATPPIEQPASGDGDRDHRDPDGGDPETSGHGP